MTLREELSNTYQRASTLSGLGDPSLVKSKIILINETENSTQYLYEVCLSAINQQGRGCD